MIDDPFFNPIAMQLIEMPPASRQTLETRDRHSSDKVDPKLEFPIESAKSWVREMLNEQWVYSPNTPFVAFPQENGAADVIRAHYIVDGSDVDIAQTLYIISIRVQTSTHSTTSIGAKSAQEFARKIFNEPERMRFEASGSFDAGKWGTQISTRDPNTPPGWPNWIDDLRWWQTETSIGFVTIKSVGGPTKASISVAPEQNKHWF